MPLIDVAEIGQIQKLLTKSHDELSHSLKLLDRIGSRFHDYKNIYHEVNPWLSILRDTSKQNVEMIPALVESVKNHSLLKVHTKAAGMTDQGIFLGPNSFKDPENKHRANPCGKPFLSLLVFLWSYMSFVPFIGGVSILASLIAFLLVIPEDSIWRFQKTAEPIKSLSNSLFSRTLASFMDNPFLLPTPYANSLVVSSARGITQVSIHTTKFIASNEAIFSIPADLSGLVIDGIHNIPFELSQLSGFSKLNEEIKTILSIAFHKSNDLERSSPLGLLWKGVGVEPIPDNRWIKYKGLFTLQNATTGIDEIDDTVSRASNIVSETLQFARSHNLARSFGITETEIKWSYIFLHAFGVLGPQGRKIIIAPLVFARHSTNQARTVSISESADTIDIVTSSLSNLDRGEEILVDGKPYLSDAYAFLFHGSWIGDGSIHRGKVTLRSNSNSKIDYWFSNVEEESTMFREWLLSMFTSSLHDSSWAEIRAIHAILHSLQMELESLRPSLSSAKNGVIDCPLERIRFIYFNGILTEINFFESLLGMKRSEIFDGHNHL